MELVFYLANVTARSLGLAAIALAGVWVFRVKTAAARHAALTMVTGGMLLLAAFTTTLPAIPVRVLRAEPAVAAITPAADLWVDAAVPVTPLAVQPVVRQPEKARWLADLRWPVVASAVYLGVALVLLLRLAYGYVFTRRLVRASKREGEIYESTWISVPMTVGWMRPKILLPVGWKEWDAVKLEAVMAHERMHIRRGDWAIAALAAFNRSVFWFNPLAWWMERKLAFLAEQACDDAALLETGAREPYAEALLDMAAAVKTGRGRMVWEAMAMARTMEVRKRIERILDETRQVPRGLTRARWAALIACSLPLMVVAAAAQLAPAQDTRAAIRAEYTGPVETAQPQAAPVELAQALPAAATLEGAGAAVKGGRGGPNSQTTSLSEMRYQDRRLVCLYFDLQSMSADEVAHIRNSAQTIVGSHLADTDLAAIMTYTGQLKVVQDFTADRSLLIQEIESLQGSASQSGGSADDTGFAPGDAEFKIFNSDRRLSALESAVKMLGTLPEKKALMYFGAGVNRNGTANDAQLRATINAALGSNVSFYPVDTSAVQEGAFLKTEVAETVVRASVQAPYPYRLSMGATPVQKPDPVYPAEALAAGFQGNVRFQVVVGTDGHVRDVKLIGGPSCPGRTCGAEAMVAAARDAVSHYVYEPARAPNGEPAEFETAVIVPFRLSGVVTGQPSTDTLNEIRILTQNYQALYGRNVADSGGDHPAQVLSKVNPEYPYALRAQGHQGTVTLEVTVGADGVPKDIRIVRSDPAIDAAVLTAVRQWRFTPARQGGQAVESTVTLPFAFVLE
jgi:VWFA-related protein/TonB family protein